MMLTLFKKAIVFLAFIMLVPYGSKAWGPEGHAIVGKIAMYFVKDDVRQNILQVLGNISIDTAANWMDIMKSNQDYEYMRPWHYIDFPKEQSYLPTTNENIINRLIITFNELKHKNTLCSDQVRTDLLILMHLMGDLHMPLHTAYDDDLGGNKVTIQYDTMKTHNLHRFWDEDIIRLGKIALEDCLQLYKSYPEGKVDSIGGIDFVRWMNENRSLLNQVYDFQGYTITKEYLEKNKIVVERQLLLAGLRLASLLNKLFSTPVPLLNMQELTSKYKNGIDVKDVMQNIGKTVTVCSRVFGLRSTEKITLINLGEKFPNSPLTIAIFAKSYPNFKTPPGEMYRDKNICVEGRIEEYKGKAEIIVERPDQIMIQ